MGKVRGWKDGASTVGQRFEITFCWQMTSQELHPPKCDKMITSKVNGVIEMNLRVDKIHARII